MKKILIIMVFIMAFVATPLHAALIDRGGGLIYDTDFNITWLQDANFPSTSGYDTDGWMTWSQANNYAENLVYIDSIKGVVYDDWRLPKTLQPDPTCSGEYNGGSIGYNCLGGEMGHLYYTELGNPQGGPVNNTGLFFNWQSFNYWSSTEFLSNDAWAFSFGHGFQLAPAKTYDSARAWAVRDGDVASVPEPSTILLFGSGLAVLEFLRQKKLLY